MVVLGLGLLCGVTVYIISGDWYPTFLGRLAAALVTFLALAVCLVPFWVMQFFRRKSSLKRVAARQAPFGLEHVTHR